MSKTCFLSCSKGFRLPEKELSWSSDMMRKWPKYVAVKDSFEKGTIAFKEVFF